MLHREVGQPGKDLPAVGKQIVSEAKPDAGALYGCYSFEHMRECATLLVPAVVRLRLAVDGNGDLIQVLEEAGGVL